MHVHQIWWPFTANGSLTPPPETDELRDSWKIFNPTYQYTMWDKAMCRSLIEKHYPWFLQTYDALPREIMRHDAVRPFILHHYGGIYADNDMTCYRSFDSLLGMGKVILARQNEDLRSPDSVCNAIMVATEQGHPFWLEYAKQIQSNMEQAAATKKDHDDDVILTTGPTALTSTINGIPEYQQQQWGIMILPVDVFYPIPYWRCNMATKTTCDKQLGLEFNPQAYSAHLWHGEWKNQKDSKKTWLVTAIVLVVVAAGVVWMCNRKKM